MADAVLFEFLHTEMVAELWAPDADPGSGSADRITPQHKAGLSGKKKSWSVLEGLGFRVGQALGERLPRETLAVREELDALKFLCKDLWAAMFQKHMDGLRTNHQWSVSPILVPGLHLRPSVRRPPYPGLPEPGHRLCDCPACL
ncbi:trafficking protein particle complex subunit 6A isoform X5 [Mesocricetus auratus]|uniref:Trafficking protein particle complex subunit 6A isoform X5 n=1 Tax=Mesocricetus auratus TaxID=10036 RepID=A0ABM2WHI3_MESAU|nr:trafficking protein particle complex subunit 6A isoform X5 [Mesocricetus auratus]